MTSSLQYCKAGKPARGILVLKAAHEHVCIARLEEFDSHFSQRLNPGMLQSRKAGQGNAGQKELTEVSSPTSCSKQGQLQDQIRLLGSLFSFTLKTF